MSFIDPEDKEEYEEKFYNYLNGSRRLTLQKYQEIWMEKEKQTAKYTKIDDKNTAAPLLIAIFAIAWQYTLMKTDCNNKLKSVILIDDNIINHWEMYRKKWGGQLHHSDKKMKLPNYFN